jgi:hypothetical protein
MLSLPIVDKLLMGKFSYGYNTTANWKLAAGGHLVFEDQINFTLEDGTLVQYQNAPAVLLQIVNFQPSMVGNALPVHSNLRWIVGVTRSEDAFFKLRAEVWDNTQLYNLRGIWMAIPPNALTPGSYMPGRGQDAPIFNL